MALGLVQSPHGLSRAVAGSNAMVPDGRFYPTVANPTYIHVSGDSYADHVQPAYAWRQRILYTYDDFTPSMVAAYNADSLRPTATKGLALAGRVQTFSVDDSTGHLVVVEGAGPSSLMQVVGVVHGAPRVLGTLNFGARGLGDPDQAVVGFAQVAKTSVFLLVSVDEDPSGSAFVPGTVRLTAVDLTGIAAHRARVLWTKSIPDCHLPATQSGSPGSVSGVGYAAPAHAVYFGCTTSGVTGSGYQPPDPSGVGKVLLVMHGTTPTFDHFELFPKSGNFSQTSISQFDPLSQRLLISDTDPTRGTQVEAFQTGDDVYVGSVGAGLNELNTWGLDPAHGRFYVGEPDPRVGLSDFDTQPTPLQQGSTYGQYQYPPGAKRPGQHVNYVLKQGLIIPVDPATRRLMVCYTGAGLPYLSVFRDDEAYYHEPALPNPDANTLNVPEQPGVTAAEFGASAQGYGAVYRQVGGIANLFYNVTAPFANWDSGLPVGSGTRELDAGYIGKITLDGSEASAAAIADQPDSSNTGADLQTAHGKWPFPQVTCVDFGGARTSVQKAGVSVSCDQARRSVQASALGGGSAATIAGTALGQSSSARTAVFDAGTSSVSAHLAMDPTRGAQTTVSSVARGITLLSGQVRVGELVTTVTARAHGRPGTARSVFTRVLRDVRLGGKLLCASNCSADSVAASINAEFPGRLRVDFPLPDTTLAKGSPGGYQAVVQRKRDQQLQEQQLNEQSTDRVEVPGMVATVYEDNVVPSRTVAYFAGVEAEAYYGIYRLDAGSGDSPGGAGKGTSGPTSAAAPGAPGGVSALTPLGNSTPSPLVTNGPFGPLAAVRHGLHVLVNALGRFFRLFGVWLLLLVPVYLSARRWALLSRGLFYGGPR
ncbi:MAG: hypothetical protein ACJ735_09325 [Actinomycetes bacterium]